MWCAGTRVSWSACCTEVATRRHHAAAVHGAGLGAGPVDERRRHARCCLRLERRRHDRRHQHAAADGRDEAEPDHLLQLDRLHRPGHQEGLPEGRQGSRSRRSTSSSNEEMLAKMQRRRQGLRRDRALRLHGAHHDQEQAARAARPRRYIPNYSPTSTRSSRSRPTTTPTRTAGMQYSVPYFYGTTGYAQRTDKVTTPQTAVGARFWPTTTSTRARSTCSTTSASDLGAALKLLGYLAQLHQPGRARRRRREKLIEQKPFVARLRLDQHEARHGRGHAARHVLGRRRSAWASTPWAATPKRRSSSSSSAPQRATHCGPIISSCPVGNNSRYGAHLWMNYLLRSQGRGQERELGLVPGARDGRHTSTPTSSRSASCRPRTSCRGPRSSTTSASSPRRTRTRGARSRAPDARGLNDTKRSRGRAAATRPPPAPFRSAARPSVRPLLRPSL